MAILSSFPYRTDKKADRKVKKVLKRIVGSKGMLIFAAWKKGTFFLVSPKRTSAVNYQSTHRHEDHLLSWVEKGSTRGRKVFIITYLYININKYIFKISQYHYPLVLNFLRII